jgi:hypothetical protein
MACDRRVSSTSRVLLLYGNDSDAVMLASVIDHGQGGSVMKSKAAITLLAFVQAVIGFEWARAGYEKVSDANFVAGMAHTLGVFAGKNPTGWYKDFLTGTAVPNATTLAWLVAYGEFLAGVALLITAGFYLWQLYGYRLRDRFTPVANSVVALVALVGGALMNINFWFAAGWLSDSTDGVNLVMALIQVVLAIATIALVSVVNKPTYEWDTIFTPEPKTKAYEREHQLVR